MLRISVMNEPGITRMKLEGKLAHEWVDEARKAWTSLVEMAGAEAITVDLRNVSFVDEAGHELLSGMRHGGAPHRHRLRSQWGRALHRRGDPLWSPTRQNV